MIATCVLVPSAPILLPEYTGRTDAAADLRAAAVQSLRAALAEAERLVIVAATDREPRSTRSPLGVRVGRHLTGLAGLTAPTELVTIGWQASVEDCRTTGAALAARCDGVERTALLVVGDGSARRGEKAPGHLDERSFAVDAEILAALQQADAARLLALDPTLCADLLVAGRAPWQVMAAAMGAGTFTADVARVEEPFGVRYLVATLTRSS